MKRKGSQERAFLFLFGLCVCVSLCLYVSLVLAFTNPSSKEILSKVYFKFLLLKLSPSLLWRQFLKSSIWFSVFHKRCASMGEESKG